MDNHIVSRDGMRLLRAGLRGSRTPLTWIALWSVLEAAPALASGLLTAAALDRGLLAGRPVAGLAWLALLGLLFVLRAAAERAMFPHLAEIVEPLRDHLVRHLVTRTVHRVAHSGRPADAAAVSRLTRQVEAVRALTATLLRTARPLAVTLLATAAGLATLSPLAAAFVLPPLVAALAVVPYSLRHLAGRRRSLILADEQVAAKAGDALAASRDIAALGAEEHAVAVIDHAARKSSRAAVGVAVSGSVRVLVVVLGGYVPVLALVLTGPWLIDRGALTTGALVGAVTYVSGQLVPALRALTGGVSGYLTHLGVTLTRLAESTAAAPAPPSEAAAVPAGHEITIDNLTFRYGPHSAPVLQDLSLTVPAGDHLVIVGASGIGKSTLANLLSGVDRPTSGEVRLGGVPADAVRRDIVALVPQEAYVFLGTLGDNLRYLSPQATDTDLDRVTELLGLGPLVERLGGYDAMLTQPGSQLSSGERQLLVLARVYLSAAGVVILDEATCHLDPVTEAAAERAFAARPGTLIVIAHRITSARRARRVLLLDGSHVDLGEHAALMARNPRYAALAAPLREAQTWTANQRSAPLATARPRQ